MHFKKHIFLLFFFCSPTRGREQSFAKKILQMLSQHAHFSPLRTSSSVSGISEALIFLQVPSGIILFSGITVSKKSYLELTTMNSLQC